MNPKGNYPNIVICSKVEDFLARDMGGAIYELPNSTFKITPQEGLEAYELVSRTAVRPTNKIVFKSTIKALKSLGIKIRFVDEKTFKRLINNPDQEKIIEKIKPY